jgi:Ca2+-binding EF-hand superfamily protein
LLSQVDTDGSGFIDYSEFVRASISRRKYASKEYLEMAFRRFDVDGGGKISAKDLEMVIGNCSPETETFVNAVIAEADFNKDGEIDLTEFMAVAMRKF